MQDFALPLINGRCNVFSFLGYLGGNGGTNRGGGGQGGETFGCLTSNMGKGGDIKAGWSTNTNGIGGGGAGDGPSSRTGKQALRYPISLGSTMSLSRLVFYLL